jgi:DNA-binding CsgD family transcriptional regulator
MQDAQALGIVEAAYDLSGTRHDVMRAIAEAAAAAIPAGPVAVAYFDTRGQLDEESLCFARADAHCVSSFFAWQRLALPGSRQRALSLSPRVCHFYSTDARGLPGLEVMTHPLFPFCVMANTGHGDSLCIFSNPRVREWTPVQLHYFCEVAHHLALAWRIRQALEGQVDGLLDCPREVLRRAVLAHEGCGAFHHETDSMWQALLGGQWSLLDDFTADSTRHIVAYQNPQHGVTLRALQPRERTVLELTLARRSGKWIASELHRSAATASRALRMVERRIGLGDTAGLIGLRTALFEPLELADLADLAGLAGVPGVALAVARLAPATAAGELSEAERSIVTGLLGGKRVAAIALERGTSPRTVSNQIASAYRKLGVSSRREVIALLA